jgi:hypothetical protein
MVDTPRRVRLLNDAHSTAGKMTRKNIAEATGYRILKLKMARCSERIHNRGRKAVLALYECDAIKTVENATFRFRTASHLANASALSLAN